MSTATANGSQASTRPQMLLGTDASNRRISTVM